MRLRNLPFEADYRNTHFSASTDRTLLVCTADVINEMHANGHRYPMLLARATIVEVDVIGLEES
jgi:hypothetical protein